MFYELRREVIVKGRAKMSIFFNAAHDYIKHTPLQLTSAGFSMTMSNTLTASTDFSRFSHEYIKHTTIVAIQRKKGYTFSYVL
jgi:hypothetical protein